MKRYVAPIVAAMLLLAALPASASPITECGNYVQTGVNRGYWTYRTVYGYTPVYNLTTRSVRCSQARPFSLTVTSGMRRHYQGFACRIRWFNGEDWDIRCTKGAPVVHWQGGA